MFSIGPKRVTRAVLSINEWWQNAQSQGSKHLFPLVALLEKGVDTGGYTQFEEQDDFDFWDRYCRVRESGHEFPYADPLTREFRIETHPHSNVATARKGTFAKSWGAAEYETRHGSTYWRLSGDYAEVFRRKALRRAGNVYRAPVVDLAVFFFRGEEFGEAASVEDLQAHFRERFPQSDSDYDLIFEYVHEPADQVFTADDVSSSEYDAAVVDAMLPADDKPGRLTPQRGRGGTDESVRIPDDDPVYLQVRELLDLATSGIIFRGAPATGKTWYALRIAERLTSDSASVFHVQFHPSYGYEDFVEGFRPTDEHVSGFEIVDKIFLKACRQAEVSPDKLVVFVIDEINRGDPSRIFGELLTYLETSYRGRPFYLPYTNKVCSIPPNLLLLGTMNPYDRSIALPDLAFLRRFDHVTIEPSLERVEEFLAGADLETRQVDLVCEWFEDVQSIAPSTVGHTYFRVVQRAEDLRLVWKHRIKPVCEAALSLEPDKIDQLQASFSSMYAQVLGKSRAE